MTSAIGSIRSIFSSFRTDNKGGLPTAAGSSSFVNRYTLLGTKTRPPIRVIVTLGILLVLGIVLVSMRGSYPLTDNNWAWSGEVGDMRGWKIEMGWKQDEAVGLTDLGEVAESRYQLNAAQGEKGMIE